MLFETRLCKRCNKDISHKRKDANFCTSKCQVLLWRENNPEATSKHIRTWVTKNTNEKQEMKLTGNYKKHKLTLEQFEKMYNDQNGWCKLCNRDPAKVIDHDHATGKVRGLLCNRCNTGLGYFKDNTGLLQEAITYLEENG